ncbi:hypothetical protein DICPUDRAFT_159956 [Dictyostelium purpureum]|uniref:Uncharacterized protein n=1 Tax=Dictyostelium purpureum TaxID=5786 RepID=F1A5D2_DICPU|nr:uncharacterized protein DICPUDRAFT_159956 [Dictyostelium purpureum]EGC28596.1 hypothetical protein DICPUDRAFT_159956 [Dictyostelium purpureum]|eukprot:XP_003294876.1 hypothetical protein DICPUDRAFT_159956 [Dictyostelium purpureum]
MSTSKKEIKKTTNTSKDEPKNEVKQRKKEDSSTTTTTTTTTTTSTNDEIKSVDKLKLNYPIFHCSSSSVSKEPYIACGGGGGKSKTGVPNAITLLKWSEKENSSEFINIDQMETEDCIPYIAFNDSKNQLAYFIGSHIYIVSYKNNRLEKVSDFDSNQNIPETAFNTAGNSGSVSPSSTPTVSSQPTKNTPSTLERIRFNKKGDRLITIDNNNLICVWSVPSCEFVRLIISGHQGEITDIDIHPASSHIVTTSRDCSAKIINLMNGRVEFTLQYKPKPKLAFRGCRFSHDGLYIYTAQSLPRTKQTTGCTVLTKWNFTNGNEEFSREVDTFHNTTFDLSPDSKTIAISNGNSHILAFNSESFKQLDKWEPHEFVITGACFSPDSSTIFSCSADYTCKSHRIGSYSTNNSKCFLYIRCVYLNFKKLIIIRIVSLNIKLYMNTFV